MKALVTKVFIDKISGMQQDKDTILEVTAERLAELEAHGVAIALEVAKPEEATAPEEAKPKAKKKGGKDVR